MIDTHAHLYKEYYDDIEKVIIKMDNNIIIVSGTNDENNREVLELCKKYKNVYGTIGLHPQELDLITEDSFKFIEDHINDEKIVAVGEIGLDYHYDIDKEKQKEVFIKQLELAKKYNKPVVIHSRDSIKDTYDIIKNYKELNKDIHCYSGSLESAKEFIKINCRLGIGGVLTFKNANKLQEVVKNIDIKYLLLETDSPYLSPEPFRGTVNEPCNILIVAKKIAEIKEMKLDEVLSITTSNAISQFDLNKHLC